jgi:ligand-binding sensor domain-containing protein
MMKIRNIALLALSTSTLLLLGLAWNARARARHIAVPVLSDPSLDPQPGVELAELAGCTAREVARVSARVTALLRGADGALWIGTFDDGLYRLDGELVPIDGLRGRQRFVNALAEHDGLVWVATQGGLVAFDGDRRALTVLGGEGVTALVQAGGALYAGTARGLFRVSPGRGAEDLEAVGPAGERLRVTALAAGPTALWIGTASGAYVLTLSSLEAPLGAPRTARWHPLVFGDPPAETNVVTALVPLGAGAVAGTDDGGVVRLREDGGSSAVRFADARANEVNPGAAAAAGGAAVLGTQGGGALVLRRERDATSAARLAALGHAEVSAVSGDGDRILVGLADGSVQEVSPDAAAGPCLAPPTGEPNREGDPAGR